MIDGKQHLANKKKAAAQRLIRTEAYAEKVRTLFAKTVNEILALNKTMPTLDDGVMYSFDGDSMKKQKEVEALLRRLSSTVTLAVQNGIKLEWEAANKECDQFVKSVFGKKVLSTPEFTAYMDRNTAARDAFIGRTENGLDLSKRVWKSVKQLREEMEVAMTVAIGEGDSASSMSRKVREYLNDPDLMFRRFRYKKGEKDIVDLTTGEIVGTEPIYGKKWKKRIKDEKTGKYKWIDYDRDTYKTGTGVYKSSARNAMRVTRTETNIAYRRADNARWQNMDFVIGQHIELSRSHPKKDICDDLVGDYPKDFIFDSWHPQCFCVCTPITIPPEETAHLTKMMLNGEDWRGEIEKMAQKRMITEYPQNFKDWVTDHKDKIEIARKNGTEPYFLRNNTLAVDNIINPQPKKLTPLEIAEKRHAARTPEQVEAIKRAANNRTSTRKFANKILDYAANGHPDIDTTKLQQALHSGNDELALQEARAIKQTITKQNKLAKKAANNILAVAKDYNEVDYTTLEAAINAGDIVAMQAATKSVANAVSNMKKQETALGDLIPDVHTWHKTATMAELQGVHDAVKAKLAQWAGLDTDKLAKKLNFEAVDFLGGNMHGVQQKFPNTWKISQATYLKKRDSVNYEIGIKEVQAQIKDAKAWSVLHPKATNAAKYITEVEQAIANGDDIVSIKQKATVAVGEYTKKQALQAKNEAKKIQTKIAKQEAKLQTEFSDIESKLNDSKYISKITNEQLIDLMDRQETIKNEIKALHSQFSPDAYTQARKDAALWAKDGMEAYKELTPQCSDVWKQATQAEREAIYAYTYTYSNINEPLRGLTYIGSKQNIQDGLDRIPLIEKIIDRTSLKRDMWLQRGDGMVALKKFGLSNYNTASDAEIQALVGKEGVEGAFLSAGSSKGHGFSGNIVFNIYAPKGTKAMYCEPFSKYGDGAKSANWDGVAKQKTVGYENETLIQRGTKFRITKVEKSGSHWYIDMEVIEQKPVPFPYVGGYPFL